MRFTLPFWMHANPFKVPTHRHPLRLRITAPTSSLGRPSVSRIVLHAAIRILCEPAPGSDPDGSVVFHIEGSNEVIRQAVGGSYPLHNFSAENVEPVRRADKQVAVWIAGEGENDITR